MTNTVCNGVTHSVSNAPMNATTHDVRTSVQNQNQNQRFWLLLLLVGRGEDFHPSLQSVEAHSHPLGSQQATTRAGQMDDSLRELCSAVRG